MTFTSALTESICAGCSTSASSSATGKLRPRLVVNRYAIKILGVVEFKHVPHKELVLDAQD